MKKCLIFGNNSDYLFNFYKKIFPFCTSRFSPYIGFMIITIVMARYNREELAIFSYFTALFALPVTILSMPLAMIGNLVTSGQRDGKSGGAIFLSGIPLGIILSISGFFISWIIGDFFLNVYEKESYQVYIYCVPFLIFNNYLFFFIESFISSGFIAKIKALLSLLSSLFIASIAFYLSDIKAIDVFWSFLFIEVSFLFFYGGVIFYKKIDWNLKEINYKRITSQLIKFGSPIAIGLAGQKLVYFLLTQRLMGINPLYVSDLSVIMSVIGLISIPVGAFSQIHSLFVSERKLSEQYVFFKVGLFLILLICLITMLLLSIFMKEIMMLYGNSALLNNTPVYISIFLLFITSSYMQLGMSHLRAINDTFIPQGVANIVLIILFLPIIWMPSFNNMNVSSFIIVQAACLFIICLFLFLRVKNKALSQVGVSRIDLLGSNKG
ncbi:hypothetical protein [Dickeya poaceiphila]|uniref:Oligosaccharide flippase family protein n=1 Tax=Dickeya poaceiphila TaxID=568768 RepID=A0A5Q2V1N1_9GAMM|nr:hypothetical protein [Dickeya poaceiphila]QGH59317.1 hypothetical protein Dpoa569_0003881 [Dickeya poaceiphila]